MPTLEWIGKSKVINHHQDVPFRVLERKYSFDENGEHSEDNGSDNMIIRGDNLEALKALLPRYEGRVKCIYIDPPYNTGNEGWVYNDNVNDPKIKKWLGEVVGKEGEDLTRHDKWLCMMYPRLKLLQRLLAEDGAIFISIDDNEQANLKQICDEIFGKSNFLETIALESLQNRRFPNSQRNKSRCLTSKGVPKRKPLWKPPRTIFRGWMGNLSGQSWSGAENRRKRLKSPRKPTPCWTLPQRSKRHIQMLSNRQTMTR